MLRDCHKVFSFQFVRNSAWQIHCENMLERPFDCHFNFEILTLFDQIVSFPVRTTQRIIVSMYHIIVIYNLIIRSTTLLSFLISFDNFLLPKSNNTFVIT